MAKQKWYVVTIGREVGVFKTWIETSPFVIGVSGSLYQSFRSEEEATRIFAQEQMKGNVKVVGANATRAVTVAAPDPASQLIPPAARVPTGRPLLTPRVAGVGPSERSSAPHLPVTVKSEGGSEPPLSSQYLSSPPTGITQVVCLSSSSSDPLSPLVLRENELESSAEPAQNTSSSYASSSSPRRVDTSVQLSDNDNVVAHTEHDISSVMATLGLSQDNNIPRAVDPRSPLTHPGSPQYA
ncbi:hypothetical protein C8R44DRAFT_812630 [Mycena epipterygia]|nr:hypothetical protein C8R44DRAFT_812630 [Mycena epipterygia]